MRAETIAIHSGFDADPATRAVAVPIYQTAAYAFDSADHGAALFNLEEEGYRYSRIANPTVAVLEKRVAELEGGVAALATASGPGGAALCASPMSPTAAAISSPPPSFTAPPIRCWRMSCRGRASPAASPPADSAAAMARLIDGNTRALFCETVGNPAGNICDIEAIAKLAHDHGVPLIVDNTVATPILLQPVEPRRRHRGAFADQVPGRSWRGDGRHHGGWRQFRLDGARRPLPAIHHARSHPITAWSMPSASAAPPSPPASAACYQRTTGAVLSPMSAFLLLQGIETVALARRAPCRKCPRGGRVPARRQPRGMGAICRLPGQPLSRPGAEISRAAGCRRCSPSASRAASRRARASMTRSG